MEKIGMTPWFSENTPPVRIGVYQVRPFIDEYDDGIRYAYWNGKLWSFWHSRINSLICNYELDIARGHTHDALPWRGLSENPA